MMLKYHFKLHIVPRHAAKRCAHRPAPFTLTPTIDL